MLPASQAPAQRHRGGRQLRASAGQDGLIVSRHLNGGIEGPQFIVSVSLRARHDVPGITSRGSASTSSANGLP